MNVFKILISSALGMSCLIGGMMFHYSMEPEPVQADTSKMTAYKEQQESLVEHTVRPVVTTPAIFSKLLQDVTEITPISTGLWDTLSGFIELSEEDKQISIDKDSDSFDELVDILSKYQFEPLDMSSFPDGGGTYYANGSFNPASSLFGFDTSTELYAFFHESPSNFPSTITYYFTVEEDKDNALATLFINSMGVVKIGYYDETVSNGIQEIPYQSVENGEEFLSEIYLFILENAQLLPLEKLV